jgi:hypothetical protein
VFKLGFVALNHFTLTPDGGLSTVKTGSVLVKLWAVGEAALMSLETPFTS